MVAKLGRWRPDAAVVDLEDAVPASDKVSARFMATDAIDDVAIDDGSLPATAMLLRVNPVGTPWFIEDLITAAGCRGLDGVVLPKYDDPTALTEVRRIFDQQGRTDLALLVGIETVRGVADARALLGPRVDAAYFGAEDYVADLGGRRSRTGIEVLYARSQVAIAGRLARVAVIDQAVVAIDDEAQFTADAEAGRDLGYRGKICVHPRQVALSHAVFTPGADEQDHARRVIEAFAGGVGVVDGEMVDEVHVRLARQVLARARIAGGAGAPPAPEL